MQREAGSLPEQVEPIESAADVKSDFASYTWQFQGGRSIFVGLSRIAHDRPASSTASVEADKDDICSPVGLRSIKVGSSNPTIGGK
jgi:hypothetical protein